MKVLLVDDDSITHEIISAFFQRYGQEHDTYVDIKALYDPVQGLLELASSGSQYEIILLDVRLPKLTGDEIYKSIAKKMPSLLGKVVFITASPEQLHNKLPNRDLRVLGKPFRYDSFKFQVSDIYQQQVSAQHSA